MFAGIVYFTIFLYKRLFVPHKYLSYFTIATMSWLLYLYGKTTFQFYYLANERGFVQKNNFSDMFIASLTSVIICLIIVTASKFFKDGFIAQQFEAEKKKEQLLAELENLKSQIAPHFLFNTLNNLYGLAVDKSDKLPGLMLRLSDLLRHSLYETQKPLVSIEEEMKVLKSYIELETIRLENDLQLDYDNRVPKASGYYIAPLLLIVFMENAFKHAKFVKSAPVKIYIETSLEQDWFSLIISNNYNSEKKTSAVGIGLANVKRRLEVLYPNNQYNLDISRDDKFFTIKLQLQLIKPDKSSKFNGIKKVQLPGS